MRTRQVVVRDRLRRSIRYDKPAICLKWWMSVPALGAGVSSEGFQSFLRPSEHPHDIDVTLDEREASSSGILQPPATGAGGPSRRLGHPNIQAPMFAIRKNLT